MITTTTKNEIFNKLQFYYTSRFFNTKGLQVTFARDYKDAADFENALYKENTRMFFRDLIAEYPDRNKGHIPTTIINEFDKFTREKNIPKPQQQNWLKHTYNFVKDFDDNSLSSRISKSEAVTFYQWYDTMIIKQPENKAVQDEPKKELHNNIFVGNSFEVWQSMFDEFDIKEGSRTDVKFMYEIMKSKGEELIYSTVNQKSFLEWITDTYDGLIVDKISTYNKTKSRLNAYSRAKELYKK
jgi:hypothetical protein